MPNPGVAEHHNMNREGLGDYRLGRNTNLLQTPCVKP